MNVSSDTKVFPELAPSFWEQLEIQHAAEQQDFGRLLKAFRELQNPPIRQSDLAEALGMTQSQISRIEGGRSAVRDLGKMTRWAKVVGVPSNVLWFKIADDTSSPSSDETKLQRPNQERAKEDADVDRRQFMKAAGVTGAGAAISAEAPTASRAVGASDVERLQDWTQNFRRMDNRWGGGHSLSQAAHYLQIDVLPMLRESRMTSAVRKNLQIAAAELFQLVGWMNYDTNNYENGRKSLRSAHGLAQASKDYALAAEMQAGLSHQAAFLHKVEQAEDAATYASHHAKQSGLLSVQSESAIMEAHACALRGDKRSTVRALAEAEDLFCRIRQAETPEWHRYYDRAYLSAKFGHVLRDLGQPEDAEPYARQSLDMSDGYERGRVFNLCLLAGVLADKGDLDEAIEHGALALQMTTSIKSSRTRRYLVDVAERLSPFQHDARVGHFYRTLSKRGIPLRQIG